MPLRWLEVPKKDIDALFDEWDPDGSGSLELKELDKKLRRGGEIKLDAKLQAGGAGKIESGYLATSALFISMAFSFAAALSFVTAS